MLKGVKCKKLATDTEKKKKFNLNFEFTCIDRFTVYV